MVANAFYQMVGFFPEVEREMILVVRVDRL